MQRAAKIFLISFLLVAAGCQRNIFESPTVSPATLKDVPSQRLNFRFEPDVPPPTDQNQKAQEERNPAIQNDFDTNRPLEILVKTVSSPDKNRILAVYSKAADMANEYRLDMYAPDGRILRHVTPDGMAVHFPDTIVWSPDSTTVAFVAAVRLRRSPASTENPPVDNSANSEINANTQSGAVENTNIQTDIAPAATPPVPEAPTNILTFRTEQIYTVNSEGEELKPITQNEGLVYFYYVWAPDGSALVSLAATYREFDYLQRLAGANNEVFVPRGRPRIVEKNGRERRLDDNLTAVRPVWSPDSAKVATAFDWQIRIYDAVGERPTQAAIPLRNQLLISSQKYDQDLKLNEQNINATANNASANVNANMTSETPDPTINTLPDESSLVSFNPIVNLVWEKDDLLYLQTGYIKEFKSGEGSRSYLRWHRLVFSPQAVALGN